MNKINLNKSNFIFDRLKRSQRSFNTTSISLANISADFPVYIKVIDKKQRTYLDKVKFE
jgi:hypothetical protein